MVESIGGACKHNRAIGDKETVAVELYSSIYFKSLHVAEIYICAYGTYHTRMVYKIVPYAYGIKYAYGTEQVYCNILSLVHYQSVFWTIAILLLQYNTDILQSMLY